MGRWQRYWFPDGGRINAAMARLAVATSVWMTLDHLADAPLVMHPERAVDAAYHPVGILLLTCGKVPAAGLIDVAAVVARIATVALFVGVWTRTAAAVSLIASLTFACWAVSFQPNWGHDNTFPMLALVALQGTRGGDVLGFDGWWRRRRGLPPLPPNVFEWNPRLIQLAAGLVFLSAAMFKLGASHFTLRWALSDNLRHQILAQFDLNHTPRTPLADWLLVSPARYQTAAMANMLNQFAPILACVFVRSRLRFLAAFGFVGEILGIGLVMGLWEWPWIPLAAVFIDWERLVRWLARGRLPAPSTVTPRAQLRHASRFIALFVAYDVVIAFTYPRIDQRMRTYPFTAFPMFAIVRAKPPYDVHQDYPFIHMRYRVVSADRAGAAVVEDWLHRDFIYRRVYRLGDPAQVRERLTAFMNDLPARFPGFSADAVELWSTIYIVPAYPAPARLEPHDLALMGRATRDGHWTSALAIVERRGSRLALPAALPADATLEAYVDGALTPRPLEVDADRTIGLPDGEVVLVVARTAAGPLLVTRWSKHAWW